MIKLYYAEGKDLSKDIHELELKDMAELRRFISTLYYKDDRKTVYLFTSNWSFDSEAEFDEYSKEIFVESDVLTLGGLILHNLDYSDCTLYLQEYASFEDAYKVALDMRELNHLCYNS